MLNVFNIIYRQVSFQVVTLGSFPEAINIKASFQAAVLLMGCEYR